MMKQTERQSLADRVRDLYPPPPPQEPTSSQAGLASLRGPRHSYPSVPPPGEPGSRFNPIVRERAVAGRPVEPQVDDDLPPSPATALITTLGETLESQTASAPSQPSPGAQASPAPISERYDYKFEAEPTSSPDLDALQR